MRIDNEKKLLTTKQQDLEKMQDQERAKLEDSLAYRLKRLRIDWLKA